VASTIPVGDYNPLRIPNIGLGHGEVDAGGGHTYLNAATGSKILGRGRLVVELDSNQ
jgi:hypothetical protein